MSINLPLRIPLTCEVSVGRLGIEFNLKECDLYFSTVGTVDLNESYVRLLWLLPILISDSLLFLSRLHILSSSSAVSHILCSAY